MNKAKKEIYAYANWESVEPTLVGVLRVEDSKERELFSFEYDREWLLSTVHHFNIDPDLMLYAGRQYAPLDKGIFGIFSDSCPDRWGRKLMNRREAIIARNENRKPRKLYDSDYLLGVYDISRMGALRFSLQKGGPFLAENSQFTTPPWIRLRALEVAALSFEKDDTNEQEKWINQLYAPGSSLGGARPKVSVLAPDGSLWIAKFPMQHDEWDIGAWEMVAHELARICKINVPEAQLITFSENGSTYLTKRFDRMMKNRIHFSSAMTLLQKTDKDHAENVSYLDIASFIKANGASPMQDLRELWKRIIFNMAISNTDDHLRNHGFLLSQDGWHLSPMFDVNPTVYGSSLSLNVSAYDNSIDFNLALETAPYYGIHTDEAETIVKEIKNIIHDNWRAIASGYHISKASIEKMQPAFSATETKDRIL